MILQTVKALVTRFKGRKESLEQTPPLPAANIKPIPTTTPSDDTHATTDSHPVNAQDPNAVSTPGFFSNAHNFAINNLTKFTQTFSSDGAGEADPLHVRMLVIFLHSPTASLPEEDPWCRGRLLCTGSPTKMSSQHPEEFEGPYH